MKTKKVPMRMCLGCGEMFQKKELIRVVKSKEGEISLDFTGRKAGRGAYLCKNAECLQKMIKRKSLSRSFEGAVPDEVYEKLKEEFSQNG